ncbi:Chaperone protein ClpB1 [Apostasia shenzhenica]|uniref:Chaperone protein ClpB1 n=1 Tax=Apostasia shenzhenica TaxID=1088818 RepID=A0A2I0BCC8_9ASPA|nr:Chaperone protein ClpB1 [Apostasia shenzhenica]
MRAALSTIQQTLTPEALAILNRAIADAARRRHGQTTPLHVAAAILTSTSSLLRQACLRSHPHPSSSHPLQCRALELCFSVALDRLPSSSCAAGLPPENLPQQPPPSPPISNALMAALKRAQAHQRRGCPESQQQPLLAVKVELDHLLLSILDDPSVSRVMREASFSSPAVKASIEQSLSSSPSPSHLRNVYLSPRLNAAAAGAASIAITSSVASDLTKLFDILTRSKKRNPILVGDSDPGEILREAIRRIAAADAPAPLCPATIISADKEFSFSSIEQTQIPSKIRELTALVEAHIAGGVILDLGDLKWLVESSDNQFGITKIGRAAVAEIGRLLTRCGAGCSSSRLWLVGTATCATYLRCQVYFPTMERDWQLQAVPICPRSTELPSFLPRIRIDGIQCSKAEALGKQSCFPATSASGTTQLKPPAILDASQEVFLCDICKESYEHELAKIGVSSCTESPSLPRWLQVANRRDDQVQNQEQDLMNKWQETCFRLHRNALPDAGKSSVSAIPEVSAAGNSLPQSKTTLPASPPGSPVKTDLTLGPPQKPLKFTGDAASIKRLINGLMDTVSWQPEAASAVAAAVIQSRSGGGKRRGGNQRTDTWLLFAGSDRVGKQRMANALSQLMFGGAPITIRLGSPEDVAGEDSGESSPNFRGRTLVDRTAEVIRQNPFSTIIFEDFDRWDCMTRGTIWRALEKGRMVDSHGRDAGFGSSIFIITSDWMPEDLRVLNDGLLRSEKRIMELASAGGLKLQLLVEETKDKRRRDSVFKDERLIKPRKDTLSLDLNLATCACGTVDEDAVEGSLNSSDLTMEHEHDIDHSCIAAGVPPDSSSSASEFFELVDAWVVFKPVDFRPLRRKVSQSVTAKFSRIAGKDLCVVIDDEALDRMAGEIWQEGVADHLFDETTDRILSPAIEQLLANPKVGEGAVVRLLSSKTTGQLQSSWSPAPEKVAVVSR